MLLPNKVKIIIFVTIILAISSFAVAAVFRLGLLFPFSNTYQSLEAKHSDDLFQVSMVVSNLNTPWAITFINDTDFLFTERIGVVKLYQPSQQPKVVLELSPEIQGGEGGLMGIVAHPEFNGNKFIYLCHTYQQQKSRRLKVVRYQFVDNQLSYPSDVLAGIPAANYHNGCELAFGPDKKLYITTGDAGNPDSAQQLNSLAGKILRVNPDGSVPVDNPFYDRPGARSEIYSYGHRNPQGITWQGETMISVEHGPSGIDGPSGYDEINIITKGSNYGWPIIFGSQTNPIMKTPLKYYTPAIAPGSAIIYTGSQLPSIKGDLLIAGLRGSTILAVSISAGKIVSEQTVIDDSYGRIREIIQTPDGNLLFTTSNQDGRGNPKDSDDSIYLISKK